MIERHDMLFVWTFNVSQLELNNRNYRQIIEIVVAMNITIMSTKKKNFTVALWINQPPHCTVQPVVISTYTSLDKLTFAGVSVKVTLIKTLLPFIGRAEDGSPDLRPSRSPPLNEHAAPATPQPQRPTPFVSAHYLRVGLISSAK